MIQGWEICTLADPESWAELSGSNWPWKRWCLGPSVSAARDWETGSLGACLCSGLGGVARMSSLPKGHQMGHFTSAASLWILVSPSSCSTYPTVSGCSPSQHSWQKAQFSPQKERSSSLVADSLYEMIISLEKQGEQCQICWKWCFRPLEYICVHKGFGNLPQK